MPEQAEQTDDNGDMQRTGSEDQQERYDTHGRDHTRSSLSDRCQFDDFAMI